MGNKTVAKTITGLVALLIVVGIIGFLFWDHSQRVRKMQNIEGNLTALYSVGNSSFKIVGAYQFSVEGTDYAGFVFETKNGKFLAVKGVGVIPLQ